MVSRTALPSLPPLPEYAPLVPIRERSARARTFMVDGWDGIDPH